MDDTVSIMVDNQGGQRAFKDLVIDAQDPRRIGDFWAAAIGLSAEFDGDGPDGVLRGTEPEHTIWINQVAEPRTVKQRVHLDVHASGTDPLTALGATVDTEHPGWTVMRDPEGGEFCAFERNASQLTDYRLYELVIDAADPAAISAWWAEQFGLAAQHDPADPWHWIDGGAAGLPWDLVFNPVPEPKRVKNRIHWDVWGDTADYLDAGATLLRRRDDEIGWDVLADPEGNEFCVFTR
ncbi:VOC family protein [Microlunatus soli]|uniref:Glyoxalase-like domain-containing protein n=1 Tax=Microlunatus soli TaxID=630515 RepID=A0A1H1Q6J3_9ACTN|nr:VOC family protein [Microlunatus soli]SDS18923.1 hypothetical protein SAMN04489812_1153 [Microlunatus soli]